MGGNNLFKYVFAVVVTFLIGYIIFIISQNKTVIGGQELDQTSTTSNIQTELRFAICQIDTLNPISSNNRSVQEVTKIVYDPLVTLNEHYKVEYRLADSIKKEEGNSYIISLKKGVLWQNRDPFNAYDVKFTIDRIKEAGARGIFTIYAANLTHVVDLQVLDDYTVKLILDEEVPFFEYYLTFPVMSNKFYEGEDFFTSDKVPIGTGMFRIDTVSSNMLELVPNELYWDTTRKPMATKINVNLYATNGEMYTAFKNGELDILPIKINNIDDYIGTLGYKKIEYKARKYDFLALNTQDPLLSDPSVRKALSLAIDKNNIVNTCLGAGFTPSNFSLDMGCWLYTKDINIACDTAQASQILSDAGWVLTSNRWQKRIDGRTQRLEFNMIVNADNSTRAAVAENIKTQLEMFGVEVNIQYVSTAKYNDALNNKAYQTIITGLELSYAPNLNTFFGPNNLANYSTEELNNIMEIVRTTSEENKLYDCYNRIYDIYLEDAPYIGLYRNTEVVIVNQNLVGNITANLFNIYHNIEKWYRQ